jgi:hypothetical protein
VIRHFTSVKHKKTQMVINGNELVNLGNKNSANCATKFGCSCGKEYNYIQGLSRHKKTCNYTEPICVEVQKPTEETGDVVALLMEQNKQQMQQKDKQMEQVMEQNKLQVELLTNTIKDMIPKMGNNYSTNNNQFNINMFLNEECKNAINMSDL